MTVKKIGRLEFQIVPGSEELFTSDFAEFLIAAYDKFSTLIIELRKKREIVLSRAIKKQIMPNFLDNSDVRNKDWLIPKLPEELKKPGIEITGPASITSMFINALNPGIDGVRAEAYLDDDEDSAGHRLVDTVTATINRWHAVDKSLTYHDKEKDKKYFIKDGDLPFFMHRERGLSLDEQDVTVDGKPVPATILGAALTIYYGGREQMKSGQGLYFYLPKLESYEEADFWRQFFDFSKSYLQLSDTDEIRAIILIESLPIVYQMEEVLYALGPYAAGLNAARWDLKASIFEFVMSDPKAIWPDRFDVDVKTTPFLSNIFRRLVAVCLKRGAVPIGGMATALPSKNSEINIAAAKSITEDKTWEANQGFLRAWVAHPFHMNPAAKPFKELNESNWKPTPEMAVPENYPIDIQNPEGKITMQGTKRNARMLIEYLEGWLNGRGSKGIDSLQGEPGIRPALMEDLATGRMSVAQIAQRIIHNVEAEDTGEKHDFNNVKKILNSELLKIVNNLKKQKTETDEEKKLILETTKRYEKATTISMRWIKNYCEFNFRSLGSYTRQELEEIASEKDAF